MQTNTQTAANADNTGRLATVFIAEDSIPVRERLAELLERSGQVVVVGHAETPAAAIDGILRTRPDSVVLDIHLLGGSGLEVLRTIHPVEPSVVFVVLTNHANTQYRNAFMKAGAHCVLDKSSEFEKVKETLLAACPQQRFPH
jgi:DNA-binding NarL/FixJ family response regulator